MTWRRGLAPAICIALPVAGMAWAWPDGLPPWRGGAILSAWAGTGLLLASLILAVRTPGVANRLGGVATLDRWHHLSGSLAYLLLLIHPLALAINGLDESPLVAWQTLSPTDQTWPEWLGWLALLLLMAGLAGSFGPRLDYRPWRALHWLLVGGVLLGLAHIYALLGNTMPVMLVIGASILTLGWRLIISDLGWQAIPYRVESISHCADRSIELTLAPCARRLSARPGQFVLAAFGDGPHFQACGEFHPFTLSAIEDRGRLRIAIKALGRCTRRLQALEAGVVVRLQGPFGEPVVPTTQPRLWIAGGIGITPFMAILRNETCGPPTCLIHLFRSPYEAPFLDELEARSGQHGFEYRPVSTGECIPDLAALLDTFTDLPMRIVHLCGPPALIDSAHAALLARGVGPGAIHSDRFDFR